MRYLSRPVVAGALGAAATGLLVRLVAPAIPPTGTVFVGALVAALLHWRHEDRRDFRVAGTVYALGSAGALVALPGLPAVYRWSLTPSLVVFGLVSAFVTAVFVGLRAGARVVGRRFLPEERAEAVADFVSTVASALVVAWTVIQAQERVARSAGTGLLGTAALAANWYGLRLPVEVGLIEQAVEVTVVVFVGSVLVGFHTLASWDSAWRVAERTAGRSAAAVSNAAESRAGSQE